MKVVLKTPEKMVLRTEANYSLINAIRRSVEEIPTLAIDEIEIFKNDSALYDEVLAHRLGLVPIKTDSKMDFKAEVEFTLKKVGVGTAYSGDLKGGAMVVFDGIPLTILEEKQELELVASAKFGTGLDHAKHVPGLVHYRYLLEVKSGNVKIDHIVRNSKGIIKPEKKGSKWICDLSEAEIDKINFIEKNAVIDSEELVIFIESFGHLNADKIFLNAISVLTKNVENFEKEVK